MKATLHERLQQVASRHEEIGLLLSQPEVFSDQNRFRELSMEYAHLEPLIRVLAAVAGHPGVHEPGTADAGRCGPRSA